MPAKSKEARFSEKIRSSIVLKLNARLFWRTLLAVITLDILLFAGGAAGTIYYADQSLTAIADQVEKSGIPTGSSARWLKHKG